MAYFGKFYLDKEKDIIIELDMTDGEMTYVLRTPNHAKGNLITNLAKLCGLELSFDENGLKVIRGAVPCYIDGQNRRIYILRLSDTKIANIYPDGSVERKASIPAISKTLMSQTKDYRLDFKKTIVKTYIRSECKFRTDLHTHMNANLDPDILIALGIHHQIRYPLYYVKKLKLRLSPTQQKRLDRERTAVAKMYENSTLTGKYLRRKIDDNTFINFADFILNNLENAAYNIPKIRASLTILKDGQAVFTNLEKVYLYRYVFAKGIPSEEKIQLSGCELIPDRDIVDALAQMKIDRTTPHYAANTIFQDKLLWTARGCKQHGLEYMEISDTSLVKPDAAAGTLAQVHAVMPQITRETGVTLRFLGAIRRIPLTIVKDQIAAQSDVQNQLSTLRAVACDPYVAGSDIIGEEINDIRDLRSVLREIVSIAGENEGFVVRIHAGENDSLRDNVANSIACVKEALAEGQTMPFIRIGHGLYTANLRSNKGRELIRELKECRAVLEFQLTSNVRLNNLSALEHHPLRQYLAAGVSCVQGTDGGAIYGTDSIDEQLALEKLLDLSFEDVMKMRRAENRVLEKSMNVFAAKSAAFSQLCEGMNVEEFLSERINSSATDSESLSLGGEKLDSAEHLGDRVREMPTDKLPVILLGGSFNSNRHSTRMKPELRELVERLAKELDPEKYFFVVGHRLSAYERELARLAAKKFEFFAIVPTKITPAEIKRLRESNIGIRLSIEPTGMGLYKSFAYEIFKRRRSVVVALDGNSAGANTVQEARNGKKKARIFVNRHSRILYAKAKTLRGYVTIFEDSSIADKIIASAEKVYNREFKISEK